MKTLIRHGRIITPFRDFVGDVRIEHGMIVEVGERVSAVGTDAVMDATGLLVSPGFIDIHTHGAGGADFMDADGTSFTIAGRMHLAHGVTTLLPTTVTASRKDIVSVIDAFGDYKPELPVPEMPGLHLEGPYFSSQQKGAQEEKYLRNPIPEEYREFVERRRNVKRISFAPELPGSLELADYLRKQGCLGAVAHTAGTYDDILKAMEHGVGLLTHFYSGMNGVVRNHAYRFAGPIEAGYLRDELKVEIIADGSHLPKTLLRLIFRRIGTGRIVIVSDSLRAAGLGAGEYCLGKKGNGRNIVVEDQVAKLPDRSAFAGGVLLGNELVRVFKNETDASLAEAIEAMTFCPANILGMGDVIGCIASGYRANIVLMDADLHIVKVLMDGNVVSYSS